MTENHFHDVFKLFTFLIILFHFKYVVAGIYRILYLCNLNRVERNRLNI